jgi:hypothetical protein
MDMEAALFADVWALHLIEAHRTQRHARIEGAGASTDGARLAAPARKNAE